MYFLTADHKQQHINICEDLRQITSNDVTFLSRVIIGDKSWIYVYVHEAKPTVLPVEKCKLTKTKDGETGDIKGVVHKAFVLTDQAVSSAYFYDILWRLHENI
jgi:hypothetical protein